MKEYSFEYVISGDAIGLTSPYETNNLNESITLFKKEYGEETIILKIYETNLDTNEMKVVYELNIPHVPRETLQENDHINHPEHYTKGIETLDYINSWEMNFMQGNVIKYVTRYPYKNGLEDLKKAQVYLNRLIQLEETK